MTTLADGSRTSSPPRKRLRDHPGDRAPTSVRTRSAHPSSPPTTPPAQPRCLLTVGDGVARAAVAWVHPSRPVDPHQRQPLVQHVSTAAQARVLARRLGAPAEHITGEYRAVISAAIPEAVSLIVELGQIGWWTAVVGLTGDTTAAYAARAGRADALLLLDASMLAAAGMGAVRGGGRAGASPLSAREAQVLQLIAAGHSNQEAGQLLGLSPLTIKSHLARIGRKLGTGDRAELVALGMRQGLID